jgi:xanthine dehydrogenase accessory factor
MGFWGRVAEFLEQEGKLALVTVIETRGSVPREPGASMIVLPSGAFSGTIGGGALEWQALGAAQAALGRAERSVVVRDFALGPELGQCCGGRLKVALEVLDRHDLGAVRDLDREERVGTLVTLLQPAPNRGWQRRAATPQEAAALGAVPVAWAAAGGLLQRFADQRTPVYLFGAGHVGRAVVLALAPLPFRVTWIDPRPGAFPERFPGAVEALQLPDPVAALDTAPATTFALVMTHSHPLDFAIVVRALAAKLPFVGLIGSATKRARFLKRLDEASLGEDAAERLVCPIGLPTIRSKLPAAIAAGVAADLLMRQERLAAVAPLPAEKTLHG